MYPSAIFGFVENNKALSNSVFVNLITLKKQILKKHSTVTGFNIAINNSKSAGQTIFHCHIHLIPRRDGDTPEPRGGVRGVIPDKMNY